MNTTQSGKHAAQPRWWGGSIHVMGEHVKGEFLCISNCGQTRSNPTYLHDDCPSSFPPPITLIEVGALPSLVVGGDSSPFLTTRRGQQQLFNSMRHQSPQPRKPGSYLAQQFSRSAAPFSHDSGDGERNLRRIHRAAGSVNTHRGPAWASRGPSPQA